MELIDCLQGTPTAVLPLVFLEGVGQKEEVELELGMVVPTCNPSTQEAEAG